VRRLNVICTRATLSIIGKVTIALVYGEKTLATGLLLILLVGVMIAVGSGTMIRPVIGVGMMEDEEENNAASQIQGNDNTTATSSTQETDTGTGNDNVNPCGTSEEDKEDCIDLSSFPTPKKEESKSEDDEDNNDNNGNDNNSNNNNDKSKPDCPITTTDDEGTRTTVECDGTTNIEYGDGTLVTKYAKNLHVLNTTHSSDGVLSTYYKDGGYVISFPKGFEEKPELSQTDWHFLPDGTKILSNYSGTTLEDPNPVTDTVKPDGTQITDNPDGHWYITFPERPNGTTKIYFENGTNVIVDKAGKEIKRYQD
jgi:hypothetical protein